MLIEHLGLCMKSTQLSMSFYVYLYIPLKKRIYPTSNTAVEEVTSILLI
jgi:hypothetical protein